MKIRREQRMRGDIPVGAILFLLLAPAITIGGYLIESGRLTLSQCGIKKAFDIPCLTCGATRATLHLLNGDVLSALSMQPLVISLYGVITIWGIASLWALSKGRTYFPEFSWKEWLGLFILGCAVVFGNWLYLLHAGI